MSSPTQIFLIGLGELGKAFLPHLSALPNTHVTIGVRTPTKYDHLSLFNLSLTALDLTSPSELLSETFAKYDIVISATGFDQSSGAVTKLAQDVLAAGDLRSQAGKGRLWFFPWQWGIDYDVEDKWDIMPLFGEQADVRTLLRREASKHNVKWTILSTGMFMSFLFEQFWSIVDASSPDHIVVRGLKDFNHRVTVTDVADIGKILGRIVAGDVDADDKILYAAGDTVSYREIADIVERTSGKKVIREQWTIPYLEAELAKDPDDMLKRYRLVFARYSVSWDKECTVNHKLGVPVMGVEDYSRKLFAAE